MSVLQLIVTKKKKTNCVKYHSFPPISLELVWIIVCCIQQFQGIGSESNCIFCLLILMEGLSSHA
jgi:hypothetical protein